jgi:hypothetical protein
VDRRIRIFVVDEVEGDDVTRCVGSIEIDEQLVDIDVLELGKA